MLSLLVHRIMQERVVLRRWMHGVNQPMADGARFHMTRVTQVTRVNTCRSVSWRATELGRLVRCDADRGRSKVLVTLGPGGYTVATHPAGEGLQPTQRRRA